jgi:hypothetical protein
MEPMADSLAAEAPSFSISSASWSIDVPSIDGIFSEESYGQDFFREASNYSSIQPDESGVLD